MNEYKKGQVLVMVLLTMMVLAIILISVINTSVKDRNETRNSLIYETIYSIAEKNTIDVVHSFKDIFAKLDKQSILDQLETLGYDPADVDCTQDVVKTECVVCKFKDESTSKYFANQYGENGQSVMMNICDSKELRSIETTNGNHVFFNLVGSGIDANGQNIDDFTFNVNWESVANTPISNFALEAILDIKYKDLNGEFQYTSLRSLYKNNSTKFPNLVQDESPNAEYVRFIGSENGVSFKVDKKQISDLLKQQGAGTSYAKHLVNKTNPELEFIGARFKPLFDNGSPDNATKISVRAVDAFGNSLDNISQSRFVQTTVFIKSPEGEGTGIQGSQASVETGVPIYQPPGVFDYILRANEEL
ncbi:hypothetical protein KBD45_00435 [Candidatus Dojkabacteria bacterium]|nr:hypothetical protein [Candidatus Dojkabacteria bacterium]